MLGARVKAAGLASAMFIACAAAPPPRTTTASPEPSEEDDRDESSPRVPHSCYGAEIRIDPSARGASPADVLRRPEFGPEMRIQRTERPRGEEAARAIQRAVEAAIPEIKCESGEDAGAFRFVVNCAEGDGCRTTPETGLRFVERINALVTPMMRVSLDTCACRNYH